MALETGTYISDLNASNPLGTDEKGQGDDHIRLIKSTVKATFPNLSGAMNLTHGNLNALSPFFTNPNADRIAFWDNSASAFAFLAPDGTSIAISGTTLQAGSDVPLKSAANTFTASQTIASDAVNPTLTIKTTNGVAVPRLALENDTDTWWVTRPGTGAGLQLHDGTQPRFSFTADNSTTTFNGVPVSDFARQSQSNTFTGASQSITASGADAVFQASRSGGASIAMTGSSSFGIMGTSSNHPLAITTNGTTRYELSIEGNHDFKSGSVTTANDTADEVGYKGAPSRDVSSSTNTAATDAGKTIRFTGGSGQTFTLDSDPPEDSVVVLDNASGNAWTIAASSSLVFAGATGNRTLADGCMAAAIHRGSGVWAISGQLT